MTKEEIKTLIDTKIAGQGTNVDGGGALATILNGIVDAMPEGGGAEPLVVSGVFDGLGFNPNPGGPTFNEALAAFTSGASVLLYSDTDDYYLKILGTDGRSLWYYHIIEGDFGHWDN